MDLLFSQGQALALTPTPLSHFQANEERVGIGLLWFDWLNQRALEPWARKVKTKGPQAVRPSGL
jgi:hypothetical protein